MNTPRSGKKRMNMNQRAFAQPLWSLRRTLSTNVHRTTKITRKNAVKTTWDTHQLPRRREPSASRGSYGPERLADMKRRYDPTRALHDNQNIAP